jgi:predicted dehydrogenase
MSLNRFVPVTDAPGTGDVPDLNVGLLGYNFMAKAHSNAYKTIPYIYWPPAARPHLLAIGGRTEDRVAEAARRYGYEGYYTHWEDLVADERIQLFDNCASHHMHLEPTIAALQAGKDVMSEKPLALNAAEAHRMLQVARQSGRKHACSFNYRFVPAVRLARELIDKGLLGDIYHFRIAYLQQSIHDPHKPLGKPIDPASRTIGAQGIIGCHAVDMARFLVGELGTISALAPRFVPERPGPDNQPVRIESDDASLALVEFENGAVGTIESSRVATGRKNSLRWEINGSRGSMAFDLERLNELQVYLADAPVAEVVGFQNVLVTEANHPFSRVWWPNGHIIGWEHSHINQLNNLIESIVLDRDVGPYGATFEDGYRAAVIAEVIEKHPPSGGRQDDS